MGDDIQGLKVERTSVATASASGRADAVFVEAFPDISRARIQRLMQQGLALVDGAQIGKAARVETGARLTLELPVRARPAVTLNLEIPVLLQDEAALVIDKPAGISVHGGPEDSSPTIALWFESRFSEDAAKFDVERPGIVHRLDKGTSGVMLLARTPEAQAAFSKAFADRDTNKRYVALVEGVPERPRAVIDAPIGRHKGDRTKMAVLDAGRPSKTEYELLGTAHGRSLLLLKPETGRTHQIRVHLAATGMPVVDDGVYGKGGGGRHLLHAWRLEVPHPGGGTLTATAPLPRDMVDEVRALGLEAVALEYNEAPTANVEETGD
jgi:23S rRNA pseudouridine1911/1915/1917 synthase